jgi:hypothetical protein
MIACTASSFPHVTLALGAGPENTGVPWHFHGAGFLEVLLGRKRWFLNPPDAPLPAYDPNATVSTWWEGYQRLMRQPDKQQTTRGGESMLICDLDPGESIYFPPRWYHATLNTGEGWNAWMATFV